MDCMTPASQQIISHLRLVLICSQEDDILDFLSMLLHPSHQSVCILYLRVIRTVYTRTQARKEILTDQVVSIGDRTRWNMCVDLLYRGVSVLYSMKMNFIFQ